MTTTPTQKSLLLSILLAFMLVPGLALAGQNISVSTVGVQGYDLVAYHTEGGPVKGNGNHVATHDGVDYLFTSDANRKAFEANPARYLPAYGGWCAYGVSVGKKFVGDPLAWKIVEGKLYLNLDKKVQNLWIKDIPGNISKADAQWPRIADKSPAVL